MYEDKSSQEAQKKHKQYSQGGNLSQNIKELYGEEFGKLTPGQQQYILDNQEIMRRITQQILNRVARVNIPRDLRVNRTNVIEFKLHPNGDMTDFRFLKKSGYYVLDDTTKETIEYAYSRYPRTKETTLIRYNVFYNLAY
jgi:outer membrane biosynthesis protein TonB